MTYFSALYLAVALTEALSLA